MTILYIKIDNNLCRLKKFFSTYFYNRDKQCQIISMANYSNIKCLLIVIHNFNSYLQ